MADSQTKKSLGFVELVKRAKTGDNAAIRELIAQTEQPVRFTVYGMIGTGYEADDIAHDALIHAIQNIDKCDAAHDGQVAAWFITLTANRVKDYLRSVERERAALNDLAAEWLRSPPIIAYATARWAAPSATTRTSAALLALGDLRDPAPFIEAIEDPARPSLHPTAAAALGVLDDPAARDTLARYLAKSVVKDGVYGPRTCLPAAELAAYGLAPLAFGL